MDIVATIENITRRSEAVAILEYANSSTERQGELRRKARETIGSELAMAIHGGNFDQADREEYADLDRESRLNISNHELTEDQRLDDPRHTEIH